MNKNQLIIVSIVFVVILAGALALIGMRSTSKKEVLPEPTPTPAYQEIDDSVTATLVPNAKKTAVSLTITGLSGRYSKIEYELNYQTDKGPKGTLSGKNPILLAEGLDIFDREIELGTCSTGGKCTYDTGVKNFELFVKLHTYSDEIFVLKKSFESI